MTRQHPLLPKLTDQLAAGRCSRRDFLRSATLLGVSAAAAYGLADRLLGTATRGEARAEALPQGGRMRLALRVQELQDPHTYEWSQFNITQQVCQFLTRTGQDNITRPLLLDSWAPNEDLTQWTLNLHPNARWHDGRPFLADDVVWNLRRILDPATGSSGLGLMKSYMLQEVEKDGQKSWALWDANAIEKLDDRTVRLNLKVPQLAVPEHLFHYTMYMLDPAENGTFGVGSNGTGPFTLADYAVGEQALITAVAEPWGPRAHLDELQFLDMGDDPQAALNALESRQVDGIVQTDVLQLKSLQGMEHVVLYEATTASTAVARMKVDQAPFDDPRVRLAMKLAIDPARVLAVAHDNLGLPAEHHHVCPIHPAYAPLAPMAQDVEKAKALLAEAGHAEGLDLEIACRVSPNWELRAVEDMVAQWATAGIRVKINNMPSASYWDVWDKVPFGFTEWIHRPLETMVLSLAYRSGVPWNESGYANPEFDALLTQAEGTVDVEERRQLVEQLERILQQDGPIVQPLWRARFGAYDQRVKGFVMHPTNCIFAEQLAIEPAA